jgi:DNA-binding response OmpR family regulator
MVAEKQSIRTLLIIEDQAPTREALASIFRAEGFLVLTACNRHEALEHMRSSAPPNLVLLDMRLAVEGSGFLEERRCDDALAAVPVIVLTEPNTDQEWVASLGATDTLAKPISIDLLLTTIRRWRD